MEMMLQKNNDFVKAETDAAVVELVKTVSTNIEKIAQEKAAAEQKAKEESEA